MLSSLRNKFINILESKRGAAISAGLYRLIYSYERNFTLVNSWSHWVFFLVIFMRI